MPSGAQFAGDELPVAGSHLPTGRKIELNHGFVGLTLDDGAHVVVEAPATFSIDSRKRMTLFGGKIGAVASGAAHGFEVVTPTAIVVDLGTEFGVNVTPGLDDRRPGIQGAGCRRTAIALGRCRCQRNPLRR